MLMLAVERKRRNWSQVDVCRKTGIAPTTLSRLERGHWQPYPGWKERLSEAFGMPADELFKPAEDSALQVAAASA